jgi:capsular polysaccharide biosynthesis protein
MAIRARALRAPRALGERLATRSAWRLRRRRTEVRPPGPDAGRDFLDVLDAHLAATPSPVVAVLSHDDPDPVVSRIRAVSRSRLHVVDPDADPAELHTRLAAYGWFDLIVDETRGPGREARARATFLHLRKGGTLLLRRHPPARARRGRRDRPGPGERELARLVSTLSRTALAGSVPGTGRDAKDERAFGEAVSAITVQPCCVSLRNGVESRAKIREEQVDRVLELRGPGAGRVLAHRPATALESRAVLRASESDAAPTAPPSFTVPQISLREYRDVLTTPGQVVTQDNLMLPDSFRHNQRPRLGNKHTHDLGPDFAVVRSASRAPYLRGAYFYLDSAFRGHFGHAMTEQLSRLWAWPAARDAEPGLKAIMHQKDRDLHGFELDLYEAAGVPREDLVFVRRPVRVERLVAATPMFSQPEYVHPGIAELWAAVSDRLAAVAGPTPAMRKVFCARRTTKRPCHNAAEVEALFAGHGFDVIFSEDFPLSQQAVIFRRAEVVAGFAGSALFNLCLSRSAKKVVMISSESYTAQNEYLIASVLGHELNVAWCRPDLQMPADRFHRPAFHSGFTFDPDREGRFVEEVLAEV